MPTTCFPVTPFSRVSALIYCPVVFKTKLVENLNKWFTVLNFQRTLAPFLTQQEISNFKEFFKAYDTEGEGEISKQTSRLIFKNWYFSLINRQREEIPVGDWLGPEWTVDIRPSEQSMHQRCDIVKWEDFVLSHALHILAARPNTGSTRPYIPRILKFAREFEEEDDESECY